jgi:hypothetical protein
MSRFLVVILLILNSVAVFERHVFAQSATASASGSNWRVANSTSGAAAGTKTHAALPDLLPEPTGKTSLIGGTIRSVDSVRDQLSLQIFGGGKTTLLFDDRTRVYRDGEAASLRDLQPGARLYADTALAGKDVFAKNLRIVSEKRSGRGNGQVVDFEAASGELLLRDELSPEPVKLRLASDATVSCGDRACAAADLRAGALVSVVFHPGNGGTPVVSQVSILAQPGAEFSFSGRIVKIDLRANLLVLVDPRDRKSYEINVQPGMARINELREGSEASVVTSFDGTHYVASAITINPPPAK